MYIKALKIVFVFSFLLLNLSYTTAFSSDLNSQINSNEYDYFLFGPTKTGVINLLDEGICVYKCNLEEPSKYAICKTYRTDISSSLKKMNTTFGLFAIPQEFSKTYYEDIDGDLARTFKWDTVKDLLYIQSQATTEDDSSCPSDIPTPFSFTFKGILNQDVTLNYFLYVPNLNKYPFFPHQHMNLFISNEKKINDTENVCSIKYGNNRLWDAKNLLCINTKENDRSNLVVLSSKAHDEKVVPNIHQITSSEFSSFRKNILNNLEVLNLSKDSCVSVSDKEDTCCVLNSGICYNRNTENLDPIAENPKKLYKGSIWVVDEKAKFTLEHITIEVPYPFKGGKVTVGVPSEKE